MYYIVVYGQKLGGYICLKMKMKKTIKKAIIMNSKTTASGRKSGEKERLQPLSVRVKPHTKKFLKEESILSAREILEIYEDYNNGSEDYINSLKRDELLLKEELSEIELKLQNAKEFTEKLNDIKEAKQKRNEKIKIDIE